MLLPVHPATTLTNVPPYPPRNVTAVTGDGKATLTWFAPLSTGGSTITSYKVVPRKGTTVLPSTSFPGSASTGPLTGSVKNLTNGQAYTFTMYATNALGLGLPWQATPPITIGAPTPPLSVTVTPGNQSATLHWKPPTTTNGSGIVTYRVTPHLGFTTLPSTSFPASATGGVVTGLSNGENYTFAFVAVNGRGAGLPTTTSAITVGAPTRPSNQMVTAGPPGSATVSWTTPANNNGSAITGYVVTPRYKAVPLTSAAVSFPAGATSGTVSGLIHGQPYTFVIAAVNANGTGPPSSSTTRGRHPMIGARS